MATRIKSVVSLYIDGETQPKRKLIMNFCSLLIIFVFMYFIRRSNIEKCGKCGKDLTVTCANIHDEGANFTEYYSRCNHCDT